MVTFAGGGSLGGAQPLADTADELVWRNAREMPVQGQAWKDTFLPFGRLPARAQDLFGRRLWKMGQCSTGLCVRFITSSPKLCVAWKATTQWSPHMAPSGLKGVDLYARAPGGWRWVATGMPLPITAENRATLVSNPEPRRHEYLLYFPLCAVLESLRVGIDAGHEILPAPPYPAARSKPLCFYGTSFTQGASASRAGMAYPSIVGRWMDMPVINLGFSGSGKMEPEMASLLAEIDCSLYVLDCIPNMTPQEVRERLYPFFVALRSMRPDIPILLVDNPHYQDAWFCDDSRARCEERSAIVLETYKRLRAESVPRISYVPGCDLCGTDGEASAGNHGTDLAFMRAAEHVFPAVKRLLLS